MDDQATAQDQHEYIQRLERLLNEAATNRERLRAALKEIADMPPLIQYAGVEGKPIVYDAEQRIARKALSNEQNGDRS